MAPKVTPVTVSLDAQIHEDTHVHAVYDQIASHFSSTRYKPWPIIDKFISSLPTGSIGLDSGTGNGKYIPLPLDRPSGSVFTIGMDRSRNLLQIAQNAGGKQREVVWGDVLGGCWRRGSFDYAISIATIHHLASPERRCAAVERLLESVNPRGGRVLIYVWAIEQDELSKRSIPSSRNQGDEGTVSSEMTQSQLGPAGRDVFVPWVLSKSSNNAKEKEKAKKEEDQPEMEEVPQVFNRYYHMFEAGELRGLVIQAAARMGLTVGEEISGLEGVEIVQDGWERSNYYVELRRWTSLNDMGN